jgi:hypothetical protein
LLGCGKNDTSPKQQGVPSTTATAAIIESPDALLERLTQEYSDVFKKTIEVFENTKKINADSIFSELYSKRTQYTDLKDYFEWFSLTNRTPPNRTFRFLHFLDFIETRIDIVTYDSSYNNRTTVSVMLNAEKPSTKDNLHESFNSLNTEFFIENYNFKSEKTVKSDISFLGCNFLIKSNKKSIDKKTGVYSAYTFGFEQNSLVNYQVYSIHPQHLDTAKKLCKNVHPTLSKKFLGDLWEKK